HFPCTSPLRSDVQGYAEIGVLRTPAHASGCIPAPPGIPALASGSIHAAPGSSAHASGYTYLRPTYRSSP
ncbi:hypothetical protein, partial [uncultured Duncaniella sp.]